MHKFAFELIENLENHITSPEELISSFLNQIKKENEDLQAFTQVYEFHLEKEDSPFKGIPIAVDDSFYIKGKPIGYGSQLLQHRLAEEDDIEIMRLKNAGLIVIGKTNISEFGFGYSTQNRMMKTPNPNTGKTCLGGSGGAAVAVCTGLVPWAIGGDSTGGVRLPSAECVIYGLKPTRGRIPNCRSYLTPVSEKSFHQKGIFARHPKDIALLLSILAKPDLKDRECCCLPQVDYLNDLKSSISPLKIGYIFGYGSLSAIPEQQEQLKKWIHRLKNQGHELKEIAFNFEEEIFKHFRYVLVECPPFK